MRKGVAVPYIIAIILGIVVIGLLGYYFFVLGGALPGQATTSTCNAKRNQWCIEWSARGFSTTAKPLVSGCEDTATYVAPGDCWNVYAPGCGQLGIRALSASECRSLLGFNQTTGGGATGGPLEEVGIR